MAKRISMGSWAFVSDQGHGESEPIADLLASLRELGFDGVELGAHDLPTVDDRDRLKAALAGQPRSQWMPAPAVCLTTKRPVSAGRS